MNHCIEHGVNALIGRSTNQQLSERCSLVVCVAECVHQGGQSKGMDFGWTQLLNLTDGKDHPERERGEKLPLGLRGLLELYAAGP
jgi:hypothetical protein